ncbi:Uncharacterized protein PHSC3_000804 [Chlamydiales bacterium STE3]|nr:Uncharacterized protein PHSC3_000804 [Chlamydiales bacterium STE3]
MLVENDLKRLFDELKLLKSTHLSVNGCNITIKILEHPSKVYLGTTVYFGGNYIPKSVRNCINQKAPFDHSFIKTYLTVDEGQFQIALNYTGDSPPLTSLKFRQLIEEFSFLAQEWQQVLDEHDKNDLVYVRAKK